MDFIYQWQCAFRFPAGEALGGIPVTKPSAEASHTERSQGACQGAWRRGTRDKCPLKGAVLLNFALLC